MSDWGLLLVADGTLAITYDPTKNRRLFARTPDATNRNQHFRFNADGTIEHKAYRPKQVIDIWNSDYNPKRAIGLYDFKNASNQKWTKTAQNTYSSVGNSKYFISVSKANEIELDVARDPNNSQVINFNSAPQDVNVTFNNKANTQVTIYAIYGLVETKITTLDQDKSTVLVAADGGKFVARDSANILLSPQNIIAKDNLVVDIIPPLAVPEQPRLAYRELLSYEVELYWTNLPADQQVSEYRIVQTLPSPAEFTVNNQSYKFKATPKVKYQFALYAINATGPGEQSVPIAITLDPPPPTAPAVENELSGKKATIKWTASYDSYYPITYYYIDFTAPRSIKTIIVTSPTLSYEFEPEAGVEYIYTVRAVNSDGVTSPLSNEDKFTFTDPPPAAPPLTYEFISKDKVKFIWSNVGLDTTYELIQSSPVAYTRNAGTDLTYEVNVPLPGTYVFYVIATSNTGKKGNPSTNVRFIVQFPKNDIPEPRVLLASSAPGKYNLEWKIPGDGTYRNVFATGIKSWVLKEDATADSPAKETSLPLDASSVAIDLPVLKSFSLAGVGDDGTLGTAALLSADPDVPKQKITITKTSETSATLSWTSETPSSTPIDHYYILLDPPVPTDRIKVTAPNYVFNPPPIPAGSSVTYSFYVVAMADAVVSGPGSEIVSVTFTNIEVNVDLGFLLDATGSMKNVVEAAKNKIIEIVANVKLLEPRAKVRTGLVAYRDTVDGADVFVIQDFVDDPAIMKAKLATIPAKGGGDAPEEIAGALQKALGLSWDVTAACKILINIADAPCHGTKYHDLTGDKYPGGSPLGINPEAVLDQLIDKGVNYYILQVNRSTDKMISVFQTVFAAKGKTLQAYPFSSSGIDLAHKAYLCIQAALTGK